MATDQGQSQAPPLQPALPGSFGKIQHFVVLMLENRSFDHLLGYLKMQVPAVAGLTGNESNSPDPGSTTPPAVQVKRATSFTMPWDPGHEFEDVQTQLYGPSLRVTSPASMSGFIASAKNATPKNMADASRVMECFEPDQLPVLTTLATEFALFNGWHSPLPGPTWPNRFFVHAATSGGLTDSPTGEQILGGYSFAGGTIFKSLRAGGRHWRIYHDGLPQAAGIDNLRSDLLNPLGSFREMKFFEGDVSAGTLPDYTFIEPNYDTGGNYQMGNSMHPLNDIRRGEVVIKQVYECLRNSAYWDNLMLVITFDEHGGFYDHVPPPAAVPTGDDHKYSNPEHPFAFDLLGVRVPGIVVSAYTQRGTIIGSAEPGDPLVFDHSSIPATIEKRFGLPPLTRRDAAARSLDIALNLEAPRLSSAEAPTGLPDTAPDSSAPPMLALAPPGTANVEAPLSTNQKSFLSLALRCAMDMSDPAEHAVLKARHDAIHTPAGAADFVQEVEDKIRSRKQL